MPSTPRKQRKETTRTQNLPFIGLMMYALGLKPRSGAKILASIQDQQDSGFLLEGMLEQHVPLFRKGEKPQNPATRPWYSNTLPPPAFFPQFPPLWLLPVYMDEQQVLLSLEKPEPTLCRASFWPWLTPGPTGPPMGTAFHLWLLRRSKGWHE